MIFSHSRRVIFLSFLSLYSNCVFSEDSITNQALDLADQINESEFIPVEKQLINNEVSFSYIENTSHEKKQRVSIDTYIDTNLMSEYWRLVISNRLDGTFYNTLDEQKYINSLREAFINYQPTQLTSIDFGRINTRYGVALGYNPTDFLGYGTVRSIISADPKALRDNRLGNAMIRGQHFWNNAAVTAIFSPKIEEERNDESFSLDWGVSNNKNKALFALNYQIAEELTPQILLFQEEGSSPKLGLNISKAISRPILLYTGLAAGRYALLWQDSLPEEQQDIKWRGGISSGLTWSNDHDLTLRLELSYNGGADNKLAESYISDNITQFYMQQHKNPTSYTSTDYEWLTPKYASLVQFFLKDAFDQFDINFIIQRDFQQKRNWGFAEIRKDLGSYYLSIQFQKTYFLDVEKSFSVQSNKQGMLSIGYYF